MKDPAPEETDPERATPLDSYLIYELSGVNLTNSIASRPVCSRCDDLGEGNERLVLQAGDQVYACASWEECLGWDLFGIYHMDHDISEIAASDPPRPISILQGTVQRTENKIYNESQPDAYTLTDLSLVKVSYPGTLDY